MNDNTPPEADINSYLSIFRTRLEAFYRDSELKGKPDPTEKRCLEAYSQAGMAAKITTKAELQKHIDEVHFSVFGLNIEQRASQTKFSAAAHGDYNELDRPTWERNHVKIDFAS